MKQLRGAIPEHIAARIARLRPLDAALRECLPTDCAAHCRAAGISYRTLHVVADSPAWRARIRFHSQAIIKQINRLSNSPVERVDIRVGQPEAPGPPPAPKRRQPGVPASAARGFASLAAETDDDDLRRVLERLARRDDSAR